MFYKNFYIFIIIIIEKHINKKIIIAISFATIMVMVGFTGLMYYNPENNHGNKVTIPKLGHYIEKYNFKEVDSISHTTIFNNTNPDVANNTNKNTTITMGYTLYNGTNNVTGTLLHVYKNDKLFHESLMVNSTDNKSSNYSVIPLYSKSGNYNITEITNNTINHIIKNNKNNNISPAYSYGQVHNIYSTGYLGWFLSFNNAATQNLVTDMTFLSILVAWLGVMPGGVGTIIAFLASAILAIGAYAITNLNIAGGLHGVYFDGAYGQLNGYGTPWTYPTPWWAS